MPLGNVYLNREDTANAIKNYELGIEKSTQNGLEKAICQIKLGDIYFTMRDYVKAQPCFSGALSGIQKEYKDFKRVSETFGSSGRTGRTCGSCPFAG